MSWLYSICIGLFRLGISISSLFHAKSKKWIEGRKNWELKLCELRNPCKPLVWVHCASVGEYEQALPVIQQLQQRLPDHQFFVSFFSPSGYFYAIKNPMVDGYFYLPLDTPKNARILLQTLQPAYFILVKYEFWYHLLDELKHHPEVKKILIAAPFRPNQVFFKWYGRWFSQKLKVFDKLLVLDETSAHWARKLHPRVVVCGDPRYERTLAITQQPLDFYGKSSFSNQPILVAGSTWPKDEQLLVEWKNRNKNWKLIIAPHEFSVASIQKLRQQFVDSVRLFTELHQDEDLSKVSVLIIDTIGWLARLYRLGKIAYVGGGFSKDGVHNVLEPAAYGIPIITGPNIHKYLEAIELQQLGALITIRSVQELEVSIERNTQTDKFTAIQQKLQLHFQQSAKASECILTNILT